MARVLEPEVMEGESEAIAYDELDRRWGDVIFQGFAESALRMGVPAGRVLDVGTGSGRIAIRLAKLNPAFAIEGVDLSRSMLDLAQRNAAKEGIRNVHFSIGDAKRLPFEDGAFDLVICHQLLHQLPNPAVALREINRVGRRDGAILVRDVRRLPEPWLSLALPFFCSRYSAKLREQTCASFRAALSHREFCQLVESAGIQRATVRTHLLTHMSIERLASPRGPTPLAQLPHASWLRRRLKARYTAP